MTGLLFVTLSFVSYKRKALLMLRALFSARYFQQLLREGKLTNERIYLYTTLINFTVFPTLILVFFHFYFPKAYTLFTPPLLLYGILFVAMIIARVFSRLFLWYFTTIFNYQEQSYLYVTIKILYRLYNALLLLCTVPVMWFARMPEIIFFVYIPVFLIIFFAFFSRFLRNINGMSLIHFFIYFCSLEILPYLLLVKTLDIIYN